MEGDHASASSDSSIKFDVSVQSIGLTITVRVRSDVMLPHEGIKVALCCWSILIVLQKSDVLTLGQNS